MLIERVKLYPILIFIMCMFIFPIYVLRCINAYNDVFLYVFIF